MYDLAVECQDDFLNDHENDIVAMLHEYSEGIKTGDVVAFLISLGGVKAGVIWVEIDRYGVGNLHAGLMPEFRKGFTAYKCLREFVGFCFRKLDLRSLEAHIPTHNKVTEKLLRRFGFRKFGLRPEAILVNGEPEAFVLLYLTRGQFNE